MFGINGPISASPHNYIWMRTATLDFYAAERARGRASGAARGRARRPARRRSSPRMRARAGRRRLRVHRGPGVGARRRAAVQLAQHERDLPLGPGGRVTVFRSKSGYTGVDIGRYHQPGSNGLTFDPEGRLTICQHGNRRVIRVEPHGNVTVLADRYRGPAAEQPERPRLPLRRHAVLHRPAVRAPGRVRRPGQGARRSAASSASRDGEVALRDATSSRAPTASPSRPTSATSTSATGTPSARSSCATTSPTTARSRAAVSSTT